MPEDPQSAFALGAQAPNAFSGAVEGVKTGNDWAQRQAHIDLQKQALQQQQEQHDLLKTQFEAKVGEDRMNSYNELMTVPADSPLFKVKKQNFIDRFSDPGLGKYAVPQESLEEKASLAQMNQERLDWSALYEQMGGKKISDPQAFNKAMQASLAMWGTPTTVGFFKNTLDKELMAEALKARVTATDARTTKRIDASEINKSLSMAQTATTNDQAVLGTIKRMHDIGDSISNGKLVDTKQLLNSLNTEKTKVEMGANRLSEGSLERQRAESFAGSLAGLIQKVTNAPESANIKQFSDQIIKEADVLGEQYMKNIDTHHEQLREGFAEYPKAQQALDRSFGALRKSIASPEVLGQWNGLEKYKIKKAEEEQKKAEPKSASATPDNVRAAAARYLDLYKKAASPADKQAVLSRAKKNLASFPDLLKGFE